MDHPHAHVVRHHQEIPAYAGNTYRYDYLDGNVFIIHFFDATHRHDEGIAGQHKGYKGYYAFNYVEIAPCVYFMYWLEEVYTVSQVLDLNRMAVYTHYTYDQDGERQSFFHCGPVTRLYPKPHHY
ncbi:MoaF-related domain-containing protein [Paenibacillus xanthanilyticus]|uniref:MoaF-like domain-containing protein n=1 Tax=Paenibacillus xanthanilyticus TaxID=1783531 RepID=A0ABV8K8Y4_9BACL